jgi:hypothetical protein
MSPRHCSSARFDDPEQPEKTVVLSGSRLLHVERAIRGSQLGPYVGVNRLGAVE